MDKRINQSIKLHNDYRRGEYFSNWMLIIKLIIINSPFEDKM